MGVWYLTREEFQAAAGSVGSTANNATIDRLLESNSRNVENLLNRQFYPFTQTRYYDWPAQFGNTPIRLYLNADLLTVTSILSGGVAMTSYLLEPVNYAMDGGDGQSYSRIEVNLGGAQSFTSGGTPQRAIAVTGDWGYCNTTAPASALAFAITDLVVTQFNVLDSSAVGVGDLITVGTERMIVTNKTLDDTQADMVEDLAADVSAVTCTVDDASLLYAGEVITIDSERMFIESISDNTLTVIRAFQGSVLADHTTDLDVYAPRTLTVTRAAAGSTAATHPLLAPVTRNYPPQKISDWVLAEAVSTYHQEKAGYARTVGTGDNVVQVTGRALSDIRKAAMDSYYRARTVRTV